MTLPGIEVRPLITITGERDFNEIFFTDVRVPTATLLGPENDGWRVAMTTLTHERGGVADLHLGLRKKIRLLLDAARSTAIGGQAASQDPVLRQRLASVFVEGELLKLLGDRALSAAIHGREMGPESSLAKLAWSKAGQHLAEVAADVLGPVAADGPWARDLLYSRSLTIAGGTTQVNRNVVAQRILGLPRAD
jgi:alkylation response protein AidB-like acyl-CoA dehydrogenase